MAASHEADASADAEDADGSDHYREPPSEAGVSKNQGDDGDGSESRTDACE